MRLVYVLRVIFSLIGLFVLLYISISGQKGVLFVAIVVIAALVTMATYLIGLSRKWEWMNLFLLILWIAIIAISIMPLLQGFKVNP